MEQNNLKHGICRKAGKVVARASPNQAFDHINGEAERPIQRESIGH